MGKTSYVLLAGILVLGAILSLFAWLAGTGKLSLPAVSTAMNKQTFGALLGLLPGQKTVPKQIATIPTPVTKVVGRVDRLEGDVLTLTQRFPDGNVTFMVSIMPETQIFKPRPFIPYLLKTVHADVPDAMSKSDLTQGTLVTVTTKDDLRQTGIGKPVPATVIEITVYNTSIQGTIAEVNGTSFTMNAAVPPLPPNIPTDTLEQAKERSYTVTYTTGTTELSRKIAGKAQAVHPDALVPGAAVIVYATSDVTLLTSVPAVLIRFPDQE